MKEQKHHWTALHLYFNAHLLCHTMFLKHTILRRDITLSGNQG